MSNNPSCILSFSVSLILIPKSLAIKKFWHLYSLNFHPFLTYQLPMAAASALTVPPDAVKLILLLLRCPLSATTQCHGRCYKMQWGPFTCDILQELHDMVGTVLSPLVWHMTPFVCWPYNACRLTICTSPVPAAYGFPERPALVCALRFPQGNAFHQLAGMPWFSRVFFSDVPSFMKPLLSSNYSWPIAPTLNLSRTLLISSMIFTSSTNSFG